MISDNHLTRENLQRRSNSKTGPGLKERGSYNSPRLRKVVIMYGLIAVLSLVAPVLGGIQEQWWNVTYVENVNPDGLYPRRVIGVNGTWP